MSRSAPDEQDTLITESLIRRFWVGYQKLMGFETGAFCLYVENGDRTGPVFDFLVPDMKAAKNRLLAAGCTIVEEDPALPRCYIKDPFGLVFNIEETGS